MLRRLSRLLIIVLLLAVVAFAVSRLMGGDDEDFDDFEDLDSGFEFQETPVEIDVPATDTTAQAPDTSSASADAGTSDVIVSEEAAAESPDTGNTGDDTNKTAANNGNSNGGSLIDINGIGQAYAARLNAIGINSLNDLAQADADSIASQIEVIGGAGTVGEWINQAKTYTTGGQS
jgi:predicted flap endonuclease-1-like 5' DNA nuclease